MKLRLALLVILFAAPIVFLSAMGSYYLVSTHWMFTASWPMMLCFGSGIFLARRWVKQSRLEAVKVQSALHWTDRDQQAKKLIEEALANASSATMQNFQTPAFYLESAQTLAEKMARFYHPQAEFPIGRVTIPELLTLVELASSDLHDIIQKYIPASHMLTIEQMLWAPTIFERYQQGVNVYWAASAIFNPIETAARYFGSKMGIAKPFSALKENVAGWLFGLYIERIGHYLIELYSGRLQVGAKKYRELMQAMEPEIVTPVDVPAPVAEVTKKTHVIHQGTVSVMLFGQVNAGKSTLVNLLLGDVKAVASPLPETASITSYELHDPESNARFRFLDTPGYHHEGSPLDGVELTESIAQEAGVLLLVLKSNNPGRQPDVAFLDRLLQWFSTRPHLKLPPIVAVLTQVDLLSPAMEWTPPYDFFTGTGTKEQMIREALATVREQFGNKIATVVPVGVRDGIVFGVDEGLYPVLLQYMDSAAAGEMLKLLHREADREKYSRIVSQIGDVGGEILGHLWKKFRK